jgi:Tetratricopeptide repeat
MGLPPRIAVPILVVFAVLFLGVMGYLLRIGFGTTGSAFGPSGQVAQQGDANIRVTPAPIATEPPGSFTVPQTGTGPIRNSTALPGQSVGGGTPAGPPEQVMQALNILHQRVARNPKDIAALVALGSMEFDAQKFDKAHTYFRRALALDPTNPDVGADDAIALHQTGHDLEALAELDRVLKKRPKFPAAVFDRAVVLQAMGRREDAIAAFKEYLAIAGPNDSRAENARAALQQLGG